MRRGGTAGRRGRLTARLHEGRVRELGEPPRDLGLSAAGRPDHQDVLRHDLLLRGAASGSALRAPPGPRPRAAPPSHTRHTPPEPEPRRAAVRTGRAFIGLSILCRLHLFLSAFATARFASACAARAPRVSARARRPGRAGRAVGQAACAPGEGSAPARRCSGRAWRRPALASGSK